MRSESEHPDSSSDGVDLLDRATLALRDASTDDAGPSALLVAKTLDALHRADLRASRRIRARPTLLAAAAALLMLAFGAAVFGPMLLKRWMSATSSTTIVKNDLPARQPVVIPPPVQPRPAPILVDKTPSQIPLPAIPDGVVTGQIIFDGVRPERMPMASAMTMPDCIKLHGGPFYDESLVISADRGLANVVVSVSDGLSGWLREEFPPPSEVAVLDQQKCTFVPHVVAVMVGQQLLVKNSDPLVHNVHVMAVNNPQANLGQLSFGQTETGPFEAPEVFRIKCDVHPWMEAWVRVVDNPFFAVTGRDGRFTIHGLPPGTYTLKAWHEQLGIREQQVTLVAGKGSTSDFSFRRAP